MSLPCKFIATPFRNRAWVQVIGGYTTWEGKTHAIINDLTWRANIREENVLRTGKPLLWYEVLYDDVFWPRAMPYSGAKTIIRLV